MPRRGWFNWCLHNASYTTYIETTWVCEWDACGSYWCYTCVLQAAGAAAAAGLNTSVYAEATATAYAVGGAQAQVRGCVSCLESIFVRLLSSCCPSWFLACTTAVLFEVTAQKAIGMCVGEVLSVLHCCCAGLQPGPGAGFLQWWLRWSNPAARTGPGSGHSSRQWCSCCGCCC